MALGIPASQVEANGLASHGKALAREPLKRSGALDTFAWEDTTPVIGREYPKLNIVDDILNAENAEALLTELAITSPLPLLHSRCRFVCLRLPSLPTRRGLLSCPGQSDR